MDVREIEGYKLVKLRSPFFTKDLEWNGDWSDYCFKWT